MLRSCHRAYEHQVGVDNASIFSFTAHTHTVTDATDHSTHAPVLAMIVPELE